MKLLSLAVVVPLVLVPASRDVHAVQPATAMQMRLLFHGYVARLGKPATAIVGSDGIGAMRTGYCGVVTRRD